MCSVSETHDKQITKEAVFCVELGACTSTSDHDTVVTVSDAPAVNVSVAEQEMNEPTREAAITFSRILVLG